MKKFFLVIAILFLTVSANAQTAAKSDGPVVVRNARTQQLQLSVPPTVFGGKTQFTYKNKATALVGDGTIRYEVMYGNKLTIWEQVGAHKPVLLNAPAKDETMPGEMLARN